MGRRRWDRAFLPSHPANLCWHQVLLGVHVTRFKQICLEFTHSHVLLGTVRLCEHCHFFVLSGCVNVLRYMPVFLSHRHGKCTQTKPGSVNLTLHTGAVTVALSLRPSRMCCIFRAAICVWLLWDISEKPSHYGFFSSDPDLTQAELETKGPGHSPALLWEQLELEQTD